MNKIIFTSLALFFTVECFSQQLPTFSHYTVNNFVINPAAAGNKDRFIARLSYRNQWTGFDGAPETGMLSVHGRLKESPNSIGGIVYNDATGQSTRTGFNLAYSYSIPFGGTKRGNKWTGNILSFGLQGGVLQYTIDGSKMTTDEPDDAAVPLNTENVIVPDAGFGIYSYSNKYYVGFSIPQLLETKVKFNKDDNRKEVSRLKQHYYFFGGLYFKLNEALTLEPSGLIRGVKAAPIQFDINLKAHLHSKYWFGVSYKTREAIVLLTGIRLKKRFHFGYAYDINFSELQNYSGGSHEIFLGVDFGKAKGSKTEPSIKGNF